MWSTKRQVLFFFVKITFLNISGRLHNFFHQITSPQVFGKERKCIFSLLFNISDHHYVLYIQIRIWESHKHQKQSPEVFCKHGFVKNLINLKEKHLCWSFFLIKFQALMCNFIKKGPNTGAFL